VAFHIATAGKAADLAGNSESAPCLNFFRRGLSFGGVTLLTPLSGFRQRSILAELAGKKYFLISTSPLLHVKLSTRCLAADSIASQP
jgi:hypothetical protein